MKAILLDIEGTVTDKRFVTETLFPYARERLEAFLHQHTEDPEVAPAIAEMRLVMERPAATLADIAAELRRWIDLDLKKEPLKSLQGLIWREGYASGELKSHIYREVPEAFRRWRGAGLRLAIFSSGSVEAQKQLFKHTVAGDLTLHLSGHFDLKTGAKTVAASYAKIAAALGLPPQEIRFYTDLPGEAEAAAASGMEAVILERDGPTSGAADARHIKDLSGE